MHDSMDLEGRGIPAVFVASSEFVDAARVQAEALGGRSDAVYVPHPIQDRTAEEIEALADQAADAIVAALVAGGE